MALTTAMAIVIAAAAGVAGTAYVSSKAGEATKAQVGAAERAGAQIRKDLAPWVKAGERGLAEYETRLEIGPGEFDPATEPGYKFGFEEGMQKNLRYLSAAGQVGAGGMGGGAQKALTRYAQDYASTKYDQWLNRWRSSLTPYESLSRTGQASAAQTAQMTGQTTMAAGEARAKGAANQANLWGGFASQAGQELMDYYYGGSSGGGTPSMSYSEPTTGITPSAPEPFYSY